MPSTGIDRVLLNLTQWGDKVAGSADSAMAELMQRLEIWAKAEHAWQNRRPHTEASIQGLVTQISGGMITGTLSADMDAGLWLELARDGQWAWLWPVILNHRDDIMQILGHGMASQMTITRNPDVESEYDAAQAAWPRTGRNRRA